MKKILFSMLAVAAIASCAKTEPTYVEADSEIRLNPVTTHVTKANHFAAIEGTEYPTTENFDVYAYWNTDEAGATFNTGTLYLGGPEDAPKAVEFTNKGAYWGGKTTYYWPKNGSLRFAAYSPSHLDFAHALTNDTYSVKGYVQPNETNTTWDLLLAPTSVSYNAMTAAENVGVKFQHGLSWITLQVQAKDAEAAKAFDVQKVTIKKVVTTADLTATMNNEVAKTVWDWDLDETKTADYVVFTGSQAVTETATVIETTTAGTLVIPQAPTTVTVDYNQNALKDAEGNTTTPALENQSVTVDLVLDTDATPWEPGKHYIYTLIFGLDEILINPSVVEWEDVNVGEIDTDETAVNVSTADQLVAAVAKGGKVVLQNDITLTEALVLTADVVLDGNGKTLTSTETGSSARAINVSGATNATIKNLTINAAGERAINVIQNTTAVVIDNVTATAANYTVNVAGSAPGAKVTISNSDLTGLNTVNVGAENVVIRVVDSKITCNDQNANENYYALAINPNAVGSTITATNCEIVVNGDSYAGGQDAQGSQVVFIECTGEQTVKDAKFAIAYGNYFYTFTSFSDALAKAKDGETIILTQDVTETIEITKNVTLDLNGKNVTSTGDAIVVDNGATVIITGDGDVTASSEDTGNACALWVPYGKVTINGGNYYVGSDNGERNDCIYVGYSVNKDKAADYVSSVVINAGCFEAEKGDATQEFWVLNLQDEFYKAGSTITVKGGSFVGFDPSNNKSEGENTNFVADGYTVTEADGVYTVVAE